MRPHVGFGSALCLVAVVVCICGIGASTDAGVHRNVWVYLAHRRCEGEPSFAPSVALDAKPCANVEVQVLRRLKQWFPVVRTRSRWLNAISIGLRPNVSLTHVERGLGDMMPHTVVRVADVAVSRRPRIEYEGPLRTVVDHDEPNERMDALNYGESFAQLNQLQVPALHAAGLSGRGVRVLMLDSGFDVSHAAFEGVDIAATRDFINGGTNVGRLPGEKQSQASHGTSTLSNLAGRWPGVLYGPAFGATLLLAKTETVAREIRAEEDYFVAGLEWGEEQGAHIASASLGYVDWYQWKNMNGVDSPLTRACELAVSKGMLVIISQGNEGAAGITVPADGAHVLSVGAVDSGGGLASFSSLGPTADGRIKPEVCARGVSNLVASYQSRGAFSRSSGTSFACPLVAGVAALLLEAHPMWNPTQVRQALMQTASQASSPDIRLGWGVVDAVAALSFDALSCPALCAASNSTCDSLMGGSCTCTPSRYGDACELESLVCGRDWCASGPCDTAHRCGIAYGKGSGTDPLVVFGIVLAVLVAVVGIVVVSYVVYRRMKRKE